MLSEPLSYHLKIRDYFKRQPGLWSFFSAPRQREEQLASFKADLLKNTYQFQPGSDPLLYEKIHIAREKLGLGDMPVTAYQATHSPEPNASIVCLPNEAHMVFSGGLMQLLSEDELLALVAHELAHIKLYSLSSGELEVSDRIITAIANSPDSEAAHFETARLFRLYTEIYCDREAYSVLGDAIPVITMLLKIATGLTVVHAESYLRQAEEIFSGPVAVHSASLTHPENFIRSRALRLWQEQAETAASAISQMIEGIPELDRLDLLAQKELSGLTQELLGHYLRPGWFQTPPVVALARQYFPKMVSETSGSVDKEAVQGRLRAFLDGAHSSIRDYFAYVLLDFALADPDLEDVPLGYALGLAGRMGLTDVFEAAVKKELAYSDKQWERQRQEMLTAYNTLKEV